LQDYTTEQVMIPDMSDFGISAVHELIGLADLLRNGRREGRWTSITATLNPDASLPADESTLCEARPISYNLRGLLIDLGSQRHVLQSARVARVETAADGSREVTFVPGSSDVVSTIHVPLDPVE
jgi:hypothetical protein